MPGLSIALAFSAALAAGAVPSGSSPRLPSALALVAGVPASRGPGGPTSVASAAVARLDGPGTPVCIADVCQPVVAVPGFDPQIARPGRTELFTMLLDRTGIEPFASIASALLASGLRVEYDPGVFDGHNGWGSLTIRIRWRLDAWNEPVFPAGGIRRR